MSAPHEEPSAADKAASHDIASPFVPDLPFRGDLAFPKLTEEMLQRLLLYGQEETIRENTLLYTYGDRDTDMFVVLNGEIESRLLVEGGRSKCFRLLRFGEFTGGAEPAEYTKNGRTGTHHTTEPVVASLSTKLASADACRGRFGKHHRLRLHLAKSRDDG